ncbi:MAG: helix-turn-helix domain-containing protein, partial [Candidatus Eisenbacteria bacterium]|nr:helix-turn-helix domain-containing protein [Candidatus Eisenbacteria bacterium]
MMGRKRKGQWVDRRQARWEAEAEAEAYRVALEESPEVEFDENDVAVPVGTITGRTGEDVPEPVNPWQAAIMGTVREVAKMFRVHWKTVEIWRRREGLPCVRIRGVIRYDFSDVLRWASARKEGV